MPEYFNSVIAFGDLKEALLYFDYVVPANCAGSILKVSPKDAFESGKREIWSDSGMDAYREAVNAFPNPEDMLAFCPQHLLKQDKFHIALRFFDNALFASMVKATLGEERYKDYLVNLRYVVNRDATGHVPSPNSPEPNFPAPTLEGLRKLFAHIVQEFEMQNMAVDCSTFFIPNVSQNPDTPTLCIQKIPLVDTGNLSFSQIIEFRKDKETMKKMREFRLFAYNNYQGKSRAFVEDDVLRKLDEYKRAVKIFGLKTRNQNLTFFLKSKSVIFAGAASLYSMIRGTPDALITTAGIAAIGWKLADFAIELSNQKSDFLNLSNEHPVSFIADVKDKLERKPQP